MMILIPRNLFFFFIIFQSITYVFSISPLFTLSQKELILQLHNQYRRQVNASNMLELNWDNELEEGAKEEIKQRCRWFFSNVNVSFIDGLNIYRMNIPKRYEKVVDENMIVQAMDQWGKKYEQEHLLHQKNILFKNEFNELKDGEIEFGQGIYNSYSEIMWASTSSVGCAASSICAHGRFMICKYSPSHNNHMKGGGWYRLGKPCSQCPKEYNNCFHNLCRSVNHTITQSESLNQTNMIQCQEEKEEKNKIKDKEKNIDIASIDEDSPQEESLPVLPTPQPTKLHEDPFAIEFPEPIATKQSDEFQSLDEASNW